MKSHLVRSVWEQHAISTRGGSWKWRTLVPIALLTVLSASLGSAQGLLYEVDSTGDGGLVGSSNFCDDGTGRCTLRAAIEASNLHPRVDGISFFLPTGSVINLTRALPNVSQGVDIVGPDAGQVTVRRNTAPNYRIFNVTTSSAVSFLNLVIGNGVADAGGGINHGSGTLNLTNCVFTGNLAQNGGGVNNNGGTLYATNCTFTGNAANSNGGGIANNFFGTVNIRNSTFNGNNATMGDPSADGGGGVCNGNTLGSNGGFLKVTNSTFIGNFAYSGGAISTVAGGSATITNSTLSENLVGLSNKGGGISSDSTGPVSVKSCIIASSTGGPGITSRRDVSGIFSSSGFNLIGKSDGSTGFTAATDQVGTIASPLNPKLDPAGLQSNGGPTQTIALQLDSPAIDRGSSSGLTGNLSADQRSSVFPRTADYTSISNAAGGDGTDIGACEGTRLQITSITRLANGHMLLQGLGLPSRAHTIEASVDLSPGSFVPLPQPVIAAGTGVLLYDDSTSVGLPKQFYRLRFP